MNFVSKTSLVVCALVSLAILNGCQGAGSNVKKENSRLKRLVNEYKEENKWLAENNDTLKREKNILSLKLAAEKDKGAEVDKYKQRMEAKIAAMRKDFSIKGISTADAVINERGDILVKDILFAPGKATIGKKGAGVLAKIADILKKKKEHIVVRGHTDADPISKSKWSSNWYLSSARATRVVEFLEKQDVPGNKMSIAAFSSHRPMATNKTAKGKSQNRRVEISLINIAGN